MRRVLLMMALMAVVGLGCDSGDDAATEPEPTPPPAPTPPPILMQPGFSVEIFASNLQLPTSLAFAPDGSNRLFVNELQTGRIRIIEDGVIRPLPFAEIETNVDGGFPVNGENGLLGLAFDPDYATNGYVYVTYAVRGDGGNEGVVARMRDVNNRAEDFEVLFDGIPAAPGHQIQSLAFGPDGKLYVSVGDAYLQGEVQNLNSPLGKILRMNPDGSIPDDNPFPGTYTYATGIRNAFDLVFDKAGNLYSADNGPNSDDELNQIVAGGNYGWPDWLGAGAPPAQDFIDPLKVWTSVVSPDGMAIYRGSQFPASYRDRLFLVLFGGTASEGPSPLAKRIQVVDLSRTPPDFQDFAVYNFGDTGNPLDITEGPDGSLYFTDIFRGQVFKIRYVGI